MLPDPDGSFTPFTCGVHSNDNGFTMRDWCSTPEGQYNMNSETKRERERRLRLRQSRQDEDALMHQLKKSLQQSALWLTNISPTSNWFCFFNPQSDHVVPFSLFHSHTLWFCDWCFPSLSSTPAPVSSPLLVFISCPCQPHTCRHTHSHTMRAWLISVSPLVSVKCQNKKGRLKGTSNPNYVELKTALDTSSCRTGGGRVKGGWRAELLWIFMKRHFQHVLMGQHSRTTRKSTSSDFVSAARQVIRVPRL